LGLTGRSFILELQVKIFGVGASQSNCKDTFEESLNRESTIRKCWYALYTFPNFEKRVASDLESREIESFLPLYSSLRRWKDRRIRLTFPLFPGYVFVRIALQNRLRVLQIPNVVRLIGFGGSPTPLPDVDVEILRSGLGSNLQAEPHPFLTVGRRVRIVRGPLAGFQGILRSRKNNLRLVISVELIRSAFAVTVDAIDVEPLNSSDILENGPALSATDFTIR
jgi:transcription antitermination factor NusG